MKNLSFLFGTFERIINSIYNTKYKIIFLSGIILFFIGSVSTLEAQSTIPEAEIKLLVNNYIKALGTSNIESVHKYWSLDAIKSPGNKYMPKALGEDLHITKWNAFLNRCHFDIMKIIQEDDYYIVEGNWLFNRGDSVLCSLRLYTKQNSKGTYKLFKPIELLTNDWELYNSKYFVYHFQADIDIDDYMNEITMMDIKCQHLLDVLDIELENKIDFYKVKTSRECGKLLNSPPALAYTSRMVNDNEAWCECIVSTRFYDPHELTHAITAIAGFPDINVFFLEGLAVAEGGIPLLSQNYILFKTKELIDAGDYLPVNQIIDLETVDFIDQSNITYYEAGALINHLITSYGYEKYIKLIFRIKETNNIQRAFYEVYHASIEKIETELKDYLGLHYFTPSYKIPSNAKVHKEFRDDEKEIILDEVKEKFKGLNYDIKHLKIYTTNKEVYFQVKFTDLESYIEEKEKGEKFSTAAVIALKRGVRVNTELLRKSCCGTYFSNNQGYDILILAGMGVVVYDKFNKIDYMTGFQYDSINDLVNNTITFSIPISYLGRPEEDWKYFIGSGVQRDYGAKIVYSGIMNISNMDNVTNSDNHKSRLLDILVPVNSTNRTKMIRFQ